MGSQAHAAGWPWSPMASRSTKLWAASLLALSAVVVSDEMAFVDVSSSDTINIRSLDGGFKTKRGLAGLFEDDPMAPHDWTLTKVVQTTLKAEVAAGQLPQSTAGRKIKRLEEDMRPLYTVMPKNQDGFLDKNTARYLAHRYFTTRHGWSIKGLEPAGSAWLSSVPVTPNVRQLTKWIVPTYLLEEIWSSSGQGRLGLHEMATFVATIEHLIHAEMTDMLYSVHKTMQVPTSGDKTLEQVDTLVSIFMMVYALGVNLELSTKHDMESAKEHLDSNHQAWPELQAWAKSLPGRTELTKSGFDGMLHYIEHVADQYGQWQERDCARAKSLLLNVEGEDEDAGLRQGRAQLERVQESKEHGYRSLFVESISYLKRLGVLDTTNPDELQVVVPNYLSSQTMCLTTASFYTVCCRSECDEVLSSVETAVAAPVAPIDDVVRALQATGRAFGDALLEELRAESEGKVHLHSSSFSKWLHKALPNECADPTDHAITNPKTPDQWMSDPGNDVQETEDLISEVASVLSRFTTLGLDPNASAITEAPEYEEEEQVEASFFHDDPQVDLEDIQRSSMLDFGMRAVAILCVIGLAVVVVRR